MVAQQVLFSSWCPFLVCLCKCSHQIFNHFRSSTTQYTHTWQLCRKWNTLNVLFKSDAVNFTSCQYIHYLHEKERPKSQI